MKKVLFATAALALATFFAPAYACDDRAHDHGQRRVERPAQKSWVEIDHGWSMKERGGPWDRYSLDYNTWSEEVVWHGEKRKCKGGSRSRGIDRKCYAWR